MGFRDHPGVDVPAPERPGLDVLRSEGLGQGHGSPDELRIRLWFDPAPLFLVEGLVTVELKAAVADPEAGKPSAREELLETRSACARHSHGRGTIVWTRG